MLNGEIPESDLRLFMTSEGISKKEQERRIRELRKAKTSKGEAVKKPTQKGQGDG